MATPEGKVKDAIKKWLKQKDIYFFCPIGGAYAVHGVPDIVACAQGRFIGIECKAPGKERNTTKSQDAHIARIRESGGSAFVASSLEDVTGYFNALGLV